ncbi:MAG: hypothetical protein ABIJ42_05815 [Acidobacteriota bacterium]
MKSVYKAAVVAIMVLILIANPALLAWGNPVPGRWEKVAETKPGEKMIVHTKKGGKNTYIYRSLDNQFLHCVHQSIGEVQIELGTIDKINVPKAGKYAKNGAIWGAVGGASIGGAWAFGPRDLSDSGRIYTTGIIAGLGALGGALTGAVVGGPGETIYISKEAALKK